MKLDKYQSAVVKYEQPFRSMLLIKSAAGSGKTTTVIHKAQTYIKDGLNPNKIILTTFSNNSVSDFSHKYKKLYPKQAHQPRITTLHSLALTWLKRYYGEYQSFKIISSGFYPLKTVLAELGLLDKEVLDEKYHNRYISKMLEHIEAYQLLNISSPYEIDDEVNIFSYVKNPSGLFDLAEFYEVLDAFFNYKQDNNLLMFGDMIYLAYHLISNDKKVLEDIQNTFDVFFMDEAQDSNPLIWDFVKLLIQEHKNVKACLVYDPLQTIYQFMYADALTLLEFENGLVLDNVKQLPLLSNYRSDKNIVQASNILRLLAKEETSVPFHEASDKAIVFKTIHLNLNEGSEVADTISNLLVQGYKYSDINILTRTNKVMKQVIEPALIQREIPYRIHNSATGAKLLDRKLSDIVFNSLSLYSDNEDKVALINLLNLYFGEDAQREHIRELAQRYQDTDKDLGEIVELENNDTPKYITDLAKTLYNNLVVELDDFSSILSNIFETVIFIVESYDLAESKILKDSKVVRNSLYQLVYTIAEDEQDTDIVNLIEIATKLTETFDNLDTEDEVVIGSIHSFKGSESKVSIVTGFSNYSTPKDEDNSLLQKLYVQVTRAEEKLICIDSLSYSKFVEIEDIKEEPKTSDAKLDPYYKIFKQNVLKAGLGRQIGGIKFS